MIPVALWVVLPCGCPIFYGFSLKGSEIFHLPIGLNTVSGNTPGTGGVDSDKGNGKGGDNPKWGESIPYHPSTDCDPCTIWTQSGADHNFVAGYVGIVYLVILT